MGEQTTLRKLLESALEDNGETTNDLTYITLGSLSWKSERAEPATIVDLEDIEGNTGFGGQSFPPFWAWTANRVYFKTHYDGSERVDSLPRNPTGEESPDAYGGS